MFSRNLRKNPTDAERRLWSRLRRKQVHGLQFYRQRPIGEYIVDFYCPEAALVIEVDGSQHFSDEGLQSDLARDRYLKAEGLCILRLTNLDVLKNMDGVLQTVYEMCKSNKTDGRKEEHPL
jgi:very-short-patch-repair endonuclease